MAASRSTKDIRRIEIDAIPDRYARGWHCIGLVEHFTDGKPHTIHAFGGKLVVWAAADGTINVLDAYCRHMGGDLSQGEVKGDEVACPFHDWRWAGDGKCTSIPYARRVPLRARTAAWPVAIQHGLVFVWNDPEGNPPSEAVPVPHIDWLDDGEWTDWKWSAVVVDTNCREIVDNLVDMAHFFYVHRVFPSYFRNVFEGHYATQYMRGSYRTDVMSNDVSDRAGTDDKSAETISEATYHGPAVLVDYLTNDFGQFDLNTVLVLCHWPISHDQFVLVYTARVKLTEGLTREMADAYADAFSRGNQPGGGGDIDIWMHKTRIDNPLLCEDDGPVYQLRRWYEQFFVDVADITPEMTERFEFEVDATGPGEAWQKVVVENIARAAAGRA